MARKAMIAKPPTRPACGPIGPGRRNHFEIDAFSAGTFGSSPDGQVAKCNRTAVLQQAWDARWGRRYRKARAEAEAAPLAYSRHTRNG